MTTKPEVVKQHRTEPGVKQHTEDARLTVGRGIVECMIEHAVNVENWRAPFGLEIYKGPISDDLETGEPIFTTQINRRNDGSFAFSSFLFGVPKCDYLTYVLKSEENPSVINWRVDLGMSLDEIIRLNTDARAAAGR